MSHRLRKKQALPTALVSGLLLFCEPAFAVKPATIEPVRTKAQLVASGHTLASEKCARCHSIDKKGDSPHKDAPPFRTFADKWPLRSLEESLAEGIVTGHEDMPEVIFTPKQIDAFLVFLASLKK